MTMRQFNIILAFVLIATIIACVSLATSCGGTAEYVAKKNVGLKIWKSPCHIEVYADEHMRCKVVSTEPCDFQFHTPTAEDAKPGMRYDK